MAIVIVKNTTGSEIFISDLGIGVDGSGQLNLSELFEFEDISGSDDLKSFVQNGSFIVNDGTDDLSVVDGLNHVYHQTVYEDSFEDGGISLIAEQLRCAQIRRTTDLALTTSWVDVTFDSTDLETDTDYIEHSDVDADRVLIKDTGVYLIGYSFAARSSGATRDCISRLRLNDTSTIEGSYVLQNLYRDETHQQESNFLTTLNSGDWITLQVQAGSTPINTLSDYILHITKLEGIRGPQGEQGESGTLTGAEDLACLQIRRTTDYTDIPLSWTDVTFDSTDVENTPSIIEHNNTNTDRIDIKEDGFYFITYSFEVDDECSIRMITNDTDVIVGSERHMGDITQEGDYVSVVNHCCIAPLLEDDFITLQIMSATTFENIFAPVVITVYKLEGVVGPTGDTGAQGIQGIQGPPGDASSINDTGDLDEAQVTDIENNSGASSSNLYFYLVQDDTRSDDSLPAGISGDMTTHVVLFDGTSWTDIGPFIGIKGDKGDTGDTGPTGDDGDDGEDGKSVAIQKDSASIMTEVATINFSGDVEVTTSPSSKVNVIVGGTNICQVYDSAGGTNVNNSTPAAIPFNQQMFKDSYYTHSTSSNNSRVYISQSGVYKVSYGMCFNGGSNRRTIHSYIRKNGTTKVILSDGYSYVRNSSDEDGGNSASFLYTLTNGDYIQLMGEQAGSSGNCYALADQSWLTLEYIRGV